MRSEVRRKLRIALKNKSKEVLESFIISKYYSQSYIKSPYREKPLFKSKEELKEIILVIHRTIIR